MRQKSDRRLQIVIASIHNAEINLRSSYKKLSFELSNEILYINSLKKHEKKPRMILVLNTAFRIIIIPASN